MQLHIGSKDIDVLTLLDSGAGGNFIHPNLTSTLPNLIPLPKLLKAFNIDRTLDKKETITNYIIVNILVNNQSMTIEVDGCRNWTEYPHPRVSLVANLEPQCGLEMWNSY